MNDHPAVSADATILTDVNHPSIPDEDGDNSDEEDSDPDQEEDEEDSNGHSSDDGHDFDGFDGEEDEDMGPQPQEMEEKDHILGGAVDSKVKLQIFCQGENPEFDRWMHTIIVNVTYDGKDIARGIGRFVKRGLIRTNFWRDMEEPCQELSNIAFEIFDRYGRLNHDLKNHPIRKGTGAWGNELDHGSFFVLEHVIIDDEWRRKGLGTTMVNALIEKSRSGERNPMFTIVSPGWLRADVEKRLRGKNRGEQRDIRFLAVDTATAFYRSIGFRRIGSSSCFGLAQDPSHKSHAIPANKDFDPAEPKLDHEDDNEIEDESVWDRREKQESKKLERLRVGLPLHHASLTLPDAECVAFYESFKSVENPTATWTAVDSSQNNILHLAASKLNLQSIQWLLANTDISNALITARNIKGYTAFEALQNQLEISRTREAYQLMMVCVSDTFRGFPSEAAGCLAALQQLQSPTLNQLQKLKYGCTCGQCIDGFLSPRMKFSLLCQAEINHDLLDMDIDDGPNWCEWHDDVLTHVAPDIRQNMRTNKSLRQGFANVFAHAASALRSDISPTLANVHEVWSECGEWPPHTRNFFNRGGTIESALSIVFEQAHDQDELTGDGGHWECFQEDIKRLPECRNDHEFGFVALACGLEDVFEKPVFGRRLFFF
jgi:GNAT superfamily N-acetyltransferase